MKKFNLVKLTIALLIGVISLTGCNKSEEVNTGEGQIFTIGISQIADHPALDDNRAGFEKGLEELGINFKLTYQNAQGDIPNASTIAQKFVNDSVDLIFTIGTPSAQSAKQATENIPILFSAVTDPVGSELVASMEESKNNITGTSDASPIDKQLAMFKKLDPSIEKVGIIFNTSEANSHAQVALSQEIGRSLGLEIVTVGISSLSDLPQALESIVSRVDGIYTITDNMVASGIGTVANKAIEHNLITVGAEESHVAGGILITDGLSYFELGRQTAHMAKKILVDGISPSDIPSETLEKTEVTLNLNTLEALGLNPENPLFQEAITLGN